MNISVGEQAWQTYKEIERILDARYELSGNRPFEHRKVDQALQRLGQAVLLRYGLDSENHQPMNKGWYTIDESPLGKLALKTLDEMLSARISTWEVATPRMPVAHDSWVEGRSEGFYAQPSLKNVLKEDYSTIKKIVETKPQQALDLFNRIKFIVEGELRRLSPEESAKKKIVEIKKALRRLEKALVYKYKINVRSQTSLSSNQMETVDELDLYSISTLLDAKISKWSLRQALNLSSRSPLLGLFGLQQALWGKATALTNVENKLNAEAPDFTANS